MITHSLQLTSEPFEAIVSGQKSIESRLFDKKRQLIQLGDTIVFTNRDNIKQTIMVRVVGLLRYKTFHDLFTHNNPSKFGGKSIRLLESQINEYYSINEQHKNGIIGIEFELV